MQMRYCNISQTANLAYAVAGMIRNLFIGSCYNLILLFKIEQCWRDIISNDVIITTGCTDLP